MNHEVKPEDLSLGSNKSTDLPIGKKQPTNQTNNQSNKQTKQKTSYNLSKFLFGKEGNFDPRNMQMRNRLCFAFTDDENIFY